MKKLLFFILSFSVICCNKEIPEIEEIITPNEIIQSEYLAFETQSELDNKIKDLIALENGTEIKTKSSILTKSPKGFVSISDLENQIRVLTKSSEEDCPEMAVDEFNIMQAKRLLPDPVLHEILDTTLRISVGNELYKITELGTFITTKDNESELEGLITQLRNDNFQFNEGDSIVQINERVKLANSFISPLVDNIAYEDIDIQNQGGFDIPLTRGKDSYLNDWVRDYNISSYKWEGRTWLSNIWAGIWGENHSREHYFSKDRRMKVVAFNTTYVFYHSAGVKVEMEQRKKFLFVKYWVDCHTDNIAIGFVKMSGEISISNPPSKLYKSQVDYWNNFTGYFGNQLKSIIYSGYGQLGFVADWTAKVHNFIPPLPFDIVGKDNIDRELKNLSKDLFEMPADGLYSFLNNQVDKYVWTPTKTRIEPKDPRSLLIHWNSKKININVTGVQEYGYAKRKTVRFNSSGGFQANISGGKIQAAPWIPAKFDFKELDFFGAVYYKGSWKGIRFYQ